jgi:hypothetical protein
MMNRKTSIILLELSTYTLLFILSLTFFPVCNFYFLEKNDAMLTKPQYFFDFKIAFLFPLYQILVLIGFFSLKKVVIFRMNYFVLLCMFLSYVYINLGFTWWGASPFHPDFQAGYWLSQLFLLVTVARTSFYMKQLDDISFHPKLRWTFTLLAKGIPMVFLGAILLTFYSAKNKPIMRTKFSRYERGRLVVIQSWDYSEAYNAHVSRYFSTDSLRKEKYRLDSASFMFFDDDVNITKKFTKRARNGKLDIEEILEEYD